MVHTYAHSVDEIKGGFLVVGRKKPFIKPAPGKLGIQCSERDAGVRVQISGIDLEGKKISELITLKEEGVRTTKEYVFVNSAQILSNQTREAVIKFYDASGEEIHEITKSRFETHACSKYITTPTRLVSWGLGNNGDVETSATHAELVVYRNDRRLLIDTLTCAQTSCEESKFLTTDTLKEGDILVIEYLSTGEQSTVRAWMQTMEE